MLSQININNDFEIILNTYVFDLYFPNFNISIPIAVECTALNIKFNFQQVSNLQLNLINLIILKLKWKFLRKLTIGFNNDVLFIPLPVLDWKYLGDFDC